MKSIHPAAWIGLLLNFFLSWVLFSALLGMDATALEGDERALVEALIEAATAIKPLYYSMLAAQAVALGCIVSGLAFGLPLAVISGFLMLPASLVYLIGCALSHYRIKFAMFSAAPPGNQGAHFVFTSAALKKTRMLAIILLVSAAACLLLSLGAGYNMLDVVLAFLGMSMAGAYCMARAQKNPALSLYDSHLTLNPALFAPRLFLPYADIHQATLLDNGSIRFEIDSAKTRHILTWSLNAVAPEERRAALQELAAALTANGVALY